MEIIKRNINGKEFMFVCEYWETSQAWGHKCTLLKNDCQIGTNKVRYYNRTWESYRYQSCIRGCVSDLMNQRYETLKEWFKSEKNITKLTKKYTDEFEKYVESDSEYTDLKELYESLSYRWE